MRFNTRIEFQKVTAGPYDPATGNYADDSIESEPADADITDTGIETLKLVYGDIKQHSLTIRVQRPPRLAFDRIIVDGTPYKVDLERKPRNITTYIVSEVQ